MAWLEVISNRTFIAETYLEKYEKKVDDAHNRYIQLKQLLNTALENFSNARKNIDLSLNDPEISGQERQSSYESKILALRAEYKLDDLREKFKQLNNEIKDLAKALVNDLGLEQIKQSDKSYKLIYVFCNYCQASQIRYPEVVKATRNNENIDVFFICAQDSLEVVQYTDTCKVTSAMYLINQNRKRKLVSFYNPIKATCKYLKKQLGVNSDKMGASDFCILDINNKPIAQTNWEMKDDEYFELLKPYLSK